MLIPRRHPRGSVEGCVAGAQRVWEGGMQRCSPHTVLKRREEFIWELAEIYHMGRRCCLGLVELGVSLRGRGHEAEAESSMSCLG